ncbi:MAG: hypothetical protein J6D30_02040 [Clostridia bacterium]|nr:hypothetical protein [Clostridia bacterium]
MIERLDPTVRWSRTSMYAPVGKSAPSLNCSHLCCFTAWYRLGGYRAVESDRKTRSNGTLVTYVYVRSRRQIRTFLELLASLLFYAWHRLGGYRAVEKDRKTRCNGTLPCGRNRVICGNLPHSPPFIAWHRLGVYRAK